MNGLEIFDADFVPMADRLRQVQQERCRQKTASGNVFWCRSTAQAKVDDMKVRSKLRRPVRVYECDVCGLLHIGGYGEKHDGA